MASITSPSAAQTTYLPPLPRAEGLNEPSPKTSLCQRIYNAYRNAILIFVEFLRKYKWGVTAMILGTLLLEPWQAIKSALMSLALLKPHFDFYNTNPVTLTKEQSNKQPILLIHGNYHNESAWISLAKKLKSSNLGPVYTVRLPNGDVTDKDFEILNKKTEQIKAQYKKFNVNNIKINLVGHSRGGFLAGRMAWTALKGDGKRHWARSEDIGKVVTIGSVLDQEEINAIQGQDANFGNRICEITGKYDVLITDQSLLPVNCKEVIDSGHLGLLYSDRTHRRVIQALS